MNFGAELHKGLKGAGFEYINVSMMLEIVSKHLFPISSPDEIA